MRVRPVGQPTRGKTALNRLRQIDIYVALAHAPMLTAGQPLVVDVGFGAYAWTTLEMRERWLRINPALRVLGIEIDPERVAAALPYSDPPRIRFALGGFNVLDCLNGTRARLIRAYNVLRQYEEADVPPALDQMAAALEPGGLLIEGTSNPSGRIVAFDVYRRGEDHLEHMALVFGTNFREVVAPQDFQTILPKRLIHHALDPVPGGFFDVWRAAFTLARGAGQTGVRAGWLMAANLLRSRFGYPVDTRDRIVRRGYVALRSMLTEDARDG